MTLSEWRETVAERLAQEKVGGAVGYNPAFFEPKVGALRGEKTIEDIKKEREAEGGEEPIPQLPQAPAF